VAQPVVPVELGQRFGVAAARAPFHPADSSLVHRRVVCG
jgi:hypothetical protein